ncbi:molecular chaperone TorD family protein [Caenispirillum bisanense]|uniref:TorD/DmsD family molecular chaperone n=1 Tax=Caenispirillum bisanense TaxID=414052 RepID=UPI0031DFAD38
MRGPAAGTNDDTEELRGQAYRLLAALLARPPDEAMLRRLAGLQGDDGSTLGSALASLGAAAARTGAAAAEREYNRLFIGVERGELVPYGSYYESGFLFGPPLIRLRGDLAGLGLARADGVCEPEDHVAVTLETMADLIDGRVSGRTADLVGQRGFFERHIGTWVPRFFHDLQHAAGASFYAPVGALGKAFLAVEARAFDLPDDAPPAGRAGGLMVEETDG